MSASSRLPYDNIIDADGHINEPPDLWENYLEPQYRDRALRFLRQPDGCDYIEMDGHLSRYFTPDIYTRGYSMGMSFEERNALAHKPYRENIPFGGCNAKERLELLDREGLAKAILYPTLSLEWEAEINDPELSLAYCRAYNRWIVDFCSDSGGRLIPIAHISLGDGEAAAQELRRAVKAGAKGVFISPYTLTNKSHAHPDYDPFWTAAQDLDVPIGLHPVAEPPNRRVYQRFKDLWREGEWWCDVLGGQGPQQAFLALFQRGLFDRFPTVKVVVLESGAGWIGHLLDRMDAAFDTPLRQSVPLKEKPSFYFQRQCWISADPDEKVLSYIIDYVGADKFFWATDFPHDDHIRDYLPALERLIAPMSEQARRGILGDNVARVYGL
jgi:uncharacterized protein